MHGEGATSSLASALEGDSAGEVVSAGERMEEAVEGVGEAAVVQAAVEKEAVARAAMTENRICNSILLETQSFPVGLQYIHILVAHSDRGSSS